ncbi:HAD family hydrolase [Flavobacterium agrisoli]|uniref:phosphoserine phosphatase n=1 Tax=Flavobacterium agrisoli TaxID=2793066 RepID=A0A934PL30_9FLAO|nr:HAD family hydrolase [Flavobacterium agrisoli]MBK0368338.1 haloacid dehalogenase-like hydrolase [Flavobacterium agrisoli]
MNLKTNSLLAKTFLLSVLLVSVSACKKETSKETDITTTQDSVAVEAPLASWNEGQNKQTILDYVKDVTTEGSANFVPVADRIATFDNDGTLWSEQPVYFQLFFVMDRIKVLAKDHPEWKDKQPYKSVLENNMPELMKQGKKGLVELLMTTHAGMSSEEFEKTVKDWIATAKHPTKNKPYNQLVFQPMLELINYLKENQFKVFIVSGGGIEFMRPWAEATYGIPKDQIIGSSLKEQFETTNGTTTINKLAELDFYDDKEGKPVAINKFIGRKPVLSAGNSDGDLQMLQYAASNPLKNLEIYIHHTDSIREWSYDRKSPIGTFDKGWDEAKQKGWLVIDMKNDWKVIYPGDK